MRNWDMPDNMPDPDSARLYAEASSPKWGGEYNDLAPGPVTGLDPMPTYEPTGMEKLARFLDLYAGAYGNDAGPMNKFGATQNQMDRDTERTMALGAGGGGMAVMGRTATAPILKAASQYLPKMEEVLSRIEHVLPSSWESALQRMGRIGETKPPFVTPTTGYQEGGLEGSSRMLGQVGEWARDNIGAPIWDTINSLNFMGNTPWKLLSQRAQREAVSPYIPVAERRLRDTFVPGENALASAKQDVLGSPNIQQLWDAIERRPEEWGQYGKVKSGSSLDLDQSKMMQDAFYSRVGEMANANLLKDYMARNSSDIPLNAEIMARHFRDTGPMSTWADSLVTRGADTLDQVLELFQKQPPLSLSTSKRASMTRAAERDLRKKDWFQTLDEPQQQAYVNQAVNEKARTAAGNKGPDPLMEVLPQPDRYWYNRTGQDFKTGYTKFKPNPDTLDLGGAGDMLGSEKALARLWLKNIYGPASKETRAKLDELKPFWDYLAPYKNPARSLLPGTAATVFTADKLAELLTGQSLGQALPAMTSDLADMWPLLRKTLNDKYKLPSAGKVPASMLSQP